VKFVFKRLSPSRSLRPGGRKGPAAVSWTR